MVQNTFGICKNEVFATGRDLNAAVGLLRTFALLELTPLNASLGKVIVTPIKLRALAYKVVR